VDHLGTNSSREMPSTSTSDFLILQNSMLKVRLPVSFPFLCTHLIVTSPQSACI
jgi:hypothetical protein